jgi:SagB-type dehydrogenase family enzyme
MTRHNTDISKKDSFLKQLARDESSNADAAVLRNSMRRYASMSSVSALRTYAAALEDPDYSPAIRLALDYLAVARTTRGRAEEELSVAAFFGSGAATLLEGLRRSEIKDAVSLPAPLKIRTTFQEAVANRRSIRNFTGDRISLPVLSTILSAALGVTGTIRDEGSDVNIAVRAAPSGGGLWPIDLYLLPLQIGNLESKVYRYDTLRHALVPQCPLATRSAIVECFPTQGSSVKVSDTSVVLFLVARAWRSIVKYGPRGLRFAFHEAGAISEHVNLSVSALGFGSTDLANFYEDELNNALGFDGVNATVIHSIALGTI